MDDIPLAWNRMWWLLYVLLFALACVAFNWLLRRPKVGSYSDKHVLITGCDRGFGNMLAKRLDKLGFHVFATCLTEKGCRDIKAACSDRLTALQMDVSSSASIKQSYTAVQKLLPSSDSGLWAVVNNAGINGSLGPYEWLTRSDYQRVLDVNLLGLIEVTNTYLPLVKRVRGRVVNMSSIMGRLSPAGSGAYCISKYGVQAFSDGLRVMMSPFGVVVSMIEPGVFRTDMIDPGVMVNKVDQRWNHLPRELQEEYGETYKNEVCRLLGEVSALASDKTYLVVDALEHAITARWPKSRYLVGLDAKFIFAPLAILPSFVFDYFANLYPYPKPQCCQK